MTSAAMGSACHQPRVVLRPTPARVAAVLGDSQTFYDHDHSGPECCGAGANETGQPAESAAKCC